MTRCLGGHLALRCALDPRVLAACCFFATDVHSGSLGSPGPSDTLERAHEIKGEVMMIHGIQDTHVDRAGREKIRARLMDVGMPLTWMEVQAVCSTNVQCLQNEQDAANRFTSQNHAFIRDELSKGVSNAKILRNNETALTLCSCACSDSTVL